MMRNGRLTIDRSSELAQLAKSQLPYSVTLALPIVCAAFA